MYAAERILKSRKRRKTTVPCQVGELPSFAKHLGTEREPAGQTLTRRILQQQ